MAESGPGGALDEAIARAVRVGWRLVRRKRNLAELRDATGANRLYLEVGADGAVRDRQSAGSPLTPGAPGIGARIRLGPIVLYGALTLLLGAAAGLALVLAPIARARVNAPPAPLTQDNVLRALRRPSETGSAASFQDVQVAVSGGAVVVAVQPRLLSGTDALTVASSDMLAATESIFHAFPDAQVLTLALFGGAGAAPGPKPVELLAQIRLSASTASGLNLPALEGEVLADSTVLFCRADGYRIAPLIYQQLAQERGSTGCLTASAR